jgi:hypothetical protein
MRSHRPLRIRGNMKLPTKTVPNAALGSVSPNEVRAGDSVPVGVVAAWTLPWLFTLIALLLGAAFDKLSIPFELYLRARGLAVLVLVALGMVALLRATNLIGKKDNKPWYVVGFLVAMVFFWGLGPPIWFLTEYFLFDKGSIELPSGLQAQIELAADTRSAAEIKSTFLANKKLYADMASKIWVAVGAALATVISLVKR